MDMIELEKIHKMLTVALDCEMGRHCVSLSSAHAYFDYISIP